MVSQHCEGGITDQRGVVELVLIPVAKVGVFLAVHISLSEQNPNTFIAISHHKTDFVQALVKT